jgi:SnoaL-like domain
MHSNDDKKTKACTAEEEIRAALSRHWAASDANDFATEHQIYREDAILDYPQSGERIRGRANIQTTRTLQPSTKHFKVQRILGAGDLWITEYILSYDEKPFFTVSIMEFEDGKVVHETQYFGEPFEASAWRSRFVERIGK